MNFLLERTDSEEKLSLEALIQGKPSVVVFVRHLG